MIKLNKFWFGFLLGLSFLVIHLSFDAAAAQRGFVAYGGECLTVILPLLVIQWRMWTLDVEKEGK